MKKLFFVYSLLALSTISWSQSLDYYFDSNQNFNPAIPTPQSVVYHEVGEFHITHDRLVNYMKDVAAASPRMQFEIQGFTHEKRPMSAVIVSSEKNIKNLESLKQKHRNFDADAPVVIWQGYSIHGNEPSGANASLLYAYYLAASQSPELEKMLDEVIIILYPSFNPDGLQRFSTWANSNKNKQLTAENVDREYNEAWPRGRTNHYHFDLNRDWLPLTQPESRAKNKLFHEWRPNILTDHHEMGTNASFFFQPGVPERTHPLTPKINQELTGKIAEYHIEALDQAKSLYYSKESFDDFYYGKGSTFPDIQGCIGILFEQASSRGHVQKSQNGLLTFPFTIKNQLLTSISTLKAGYGMKTELKNFQRNHFNSSLSGGFKIGSAKDYNKLYEFSKILNQQGIQYRYIQNTTVNGKKVDYAIEVGMGQTKGKLVQAMFDTRTSFSDSIFYDVSAFNFGQSFNFEVANTKSISTSYNTMPNKKGKVTAQATYAYILPWNDYKAPQALYTILAHGYRVKVATKPFRTGGKKYDVGTLMIPLQLQDGPEIHTLMRHVASESGIDIIGVNSGNSQGINLGSNYFDPVRLPKIAIAVGQGTVSYDAGEVWHYLDVKQQIPVTKLDMANFSPRKLRGFNVFVLPDSYLNFSEKEAQELKKWVANGGVLIGYENAVRTLVKNKLSNSELVRPEYMSAKGKSYSEIENFNGGKVTGGTIVELNIDTTHPLFWGYHSSSIPYFKRGNNGFAVAEQSYQNPASYSSKVLLNGYMQRENKSFLANKAAVQVTAIGSGRVITHIDNLQFRAFWLGTEKVTANSIFFGNLINRNSCL